MKGICVLFDIQRDIFNSSYTQLATFKTNQFNFQNMLFDISSIRSK